MMTTMLQALRPLAALAIFLWMLATSRRAFRGARLARDPRRPKPKACDAASGEVSCVGGSPTAQ